MIDQSRALPPEQQFAWTVPGWPLKEMLWPGQTPERREKLLQAVKEGRLAVHAMPFSLETETLDLEDLVEGMTYSANLTREHRPAAAARGENDRRAGAHLGGADAAETRRREFPARRLQRRQQAHAGAAAVLVGRAGRFAPAHVLLAAIRHDLLPPTDWPYHTWLAVIMTGDNHGPPTAEEVEQTDRSEAAKEMPGVKVKFGKLEDFYDAFMAENNQKNSASCAATCRTPGFTVLKRCPSKPRPAATCVRWKARWRRSTRN